MRDDWSYKDGGVVELYTVMKGPALSWLFPNGFESWSSIDNENMSGWLKGGFKIDGVIGFLKGCIQFLCKTQVCLWCYSTYQKNVAPQNHFRLHITP